MVHGPRISTAKIQLQFYNPDNGVVVAMETKVSCTVPWTAVYCGLFDLMHSHLSSLVSLIKLQNPTRPGRFHPVYSGRPILTRSLICVDSIVSSATVLSFLSELESNESASAIDAKSIRNYNDIDVVSIRRCRSA